jgi:bifunctional UDP-N-acetylglucosamine pyrophosphorylase / glucosamine-1-phosphate N-acetyltransferase
MKRMAIVMAAGKGTRMKSDLPKVLVPVCGRPMIDYLLDTLASAGLERVVVVVGYRSELVREHLANRPGIEFAEQAEQLGTGHAVMMCREQLANHNGPVLIVAGDSPLAQRASIDKLFAEFEKTQPACLLGTTHKDEPRGLGRIVRDAEGRFQAIVEEKDATAEQRAITEVNMSCYLFQAADLLFALDRIRADNAQKEYYLTDCPSVLKRAGRPVEALPVLKSVEALSINTVEELAIVERVMQNQNT